MSTGERLTALETKVTALCKAVSKLEEKVDEVMENHLPHLKVLVIVSIIIGSLGLGLRIVSIFNLL